MTSSDRRVVAVMTSDEVHAMSYVRKFQVRKRGPNKYVVTTLCGLETSGPLMSASPDMLSCPTCREKGPR